MDTSVNFAGIPDRFADKEKAEIWLQSIPYDGTSTWGKGADKGFGAFLDAAENMELYDIETQTEVYQKGIHILPPLLESSSPESMYEAVYSSTQALLSHGKFLTFFGGEHSISIGIIRAFYEKFPGLTILQIDAHADLRPQYMGTRYNHACAVYDAQQHAHLVQVGIRSMDESERAHLELSRCYFMHEIAGKEDWMQESIDQMHENVYITLDLDAFDPAIMPATGTPEPGGFDWHTMTTYLRNVFSQRNVVGFDIVELAPIPGFRAPEFLVAKLYYKMLSYKFSR